jgi:hypothetical protein
MKRLRDEAPTTERALALRLVRHAHPLPPSVDLRRAVRAGLVGVRRSSEPLGSRWLVRAATALFIVGVLGLASAMGLRYWPRPRPPEPTNAPVPSEPASSASVVAPTDSPVPALAEPAAPVAVKTTSKHAPPRASESRTTTAPIAFGGEEPTSAKSIPAVPAPAVPRPAAPMKSEELSLYLDGVEALRGAHDPGRAQRLLERYRTGYPNGAFVEESWALSIEAAGQLGRGARELAGGYLARFPHGRFRAFARGVLAH